MQALALCLLSLATVSSNPNAVAGGTPNVHMRARIDGRSRLILDDDTATWQHFDWAAPGRLDCNTGATIEPTYLDDTPWFPVWADAPDCENRWCGGCFSDTFVGLANPLPNFDFAPGLVVLDARGPVGLVESPSAANGWRAVIEFDDDGWGGAYWYDVELVFAGAGTSYCTSTPNSSGNAAHISIAGSLSVGASDTTLSASGCPPLRPALFFYGGAPTQIPFADGYLCVTPFAPGLLRLAPTDVIAPDGTLAHALDFASLPSSAPITAGSTWYFQAWFRDTAAGGSGSNLTDGVQATFGP
ncbi:MAG: hypothetical protein K8S98_01770 [Planctomycetes bacterium]|nr:hypothetical protein [Planctomycetota bacterium]